MSFLIKFLLLFGVIYFLLKAMMNWIAAKVRGGRADASHQTPDTPQEAITQEDRILEYQKKSFEASEAQDVPFEEIKDPDPSN